MYSHTTRNNVEKRNPIVSFSVITGLNNMLLNTNKPFLNGPMLYLKPVPRYEEPGKNSVIFSAEGAY